MRERKRMREKKIEKENKRENLMRERNGESG